MGLLSLIGKLMSLIGGILIILQIVFGLLGAGFTLPYSTVSIGIFSGILAIIIDLLAGVGLILMYKDKFDIDEEWIEGVIILVLALLGGSTLGLIGGILVLISGLL